MAVHELALLVTYYGVTSTSIAEVIALPEDSCVQTLGGFTDFSKVGFTIKTTAGKSITVKADRCGVPLGARRCDRSLRQAPVLRGSG